MRSKIGYLEIRKMVLNRIKSKQWPLGHILPSEIELAKELGCARATVNKAMALLTDEGVIERKRKAGSRICPYPKKTSKAELKTARQTIEDMGAQYDYEQISRSFGEPPDWAIEQGLMTRSEQALFLENLHFADEKPFQHTETWINASLLPHAVDQNFTRMEPGVWLYMEMPFCGGQYHVTAEELDPRVADFLELEVGIPILQQLFQLSYEDDTLAIVRVTCHPDYKFEGHF